MTTLYNFPKSILKNKQEKYKKTAFIGAETIQPKFPKLWYASKIQVQNDH